MARYIYADKGALDIEPGDRIVSKTETEDGQEVFGVAGPREWADG